MWVRMNSKMDINYIIENSKVEIFSFLSYKCIKNVLKLFVFFGFTLKVFLFRSMQSFYIIKFIKYFESILKIEVLWTSSYRNSES